MKKLTSIVLAVVMLLSVMAVGVVNASAAIVESGSCGDNATYTLDDNGVLTISGSGDIYNDAFRDRNDIYTVNIENGVTSIGNRAFYNCTSLTSVTIPDSVTSIGNRAFCECTSLTSIIIPDSVTSIGGYAFNNCTSLTSVTIPDSVTSIGESAFNLCTSLTSVTLSNSVTSIENGLFGGCRSLTNITIPNSVTTIGWGAFSSCAFTSIIIPDSVTSIGEYAFSWCTSLNNITIPNSVISIGENAFNNCSDFSISIPNSVTSIGSTAFGYKNYYGNKTIIPVKLFTSNSVVIDYALSNHFHHSDLGEYYVNYDEPNEITQSGGSRNTKVTLTTTPANLRVTVPTVLPVSVDADNNVTVATNAQIQNLSQGQVDVTNAVLSGSNSWSLAAFDTDFKAVPVNTKQYGFKLLGYNVPVSGNAYNNQFSTIDGNSALNLTYDANVAIQSDAISDQDIGIIVFTVAWHK